jgi:endoglucanase
MVDCPVRPLPPTPKIPTHPETTTDQVLYYDNDTTQPCSQQAQSNDKRYEITGAWRTLAQDFHHIRLLPRLHPKPVRYTLPRPCRSAKRMNTTPQPAHRHTRRALLLLALASLYLSAAQAQSPSTLAANRAETHLRHGINLSEWFAQVYDPKGYTKEHFDTWDTSQDIALIKAMDFDHVRLNVNPQPMFRRRQADRIPPEYLAYLDTAVKMILDQGLAVVIDVHPDPDFKHQLTTEDSFVEEFADFWRALAHHYSTFDPDRVFFETLNEPEVRDPYRWYGIQARLAVAIREGAPQHTIIAVGARWDDDDDILLQQPPRDPNVIYNFHFYEPHVFTHQGATWGENYWHFVAALPYPADSPAAMAHVTQVAAALPDPVKRLAVIRYGSDHWNAQRIDAEFDQVAQLAQRWSVPVICNEFGAYRKAATPSDRANWLSDVRRSLEKHNIGWTMWDFSGGFGVVTKENAAKQNGLAVPDEVTIKALGRTMPSPQIIKTIQTLGDAH